MLEYLSELGYIGLFISSFLAATILPFSSEIVFTVVLTLGCEVYLSVIVATVGNSLGGLLSFWIGRQGKLSWIDKYLGIKKEKLDRIQHFLQGKGAIMSFFSFVPLVGDVIIVVLGYMRANTLTVVVCMTLGKFLRFLFLGICFEKLVSL